MNEWVSVCRIDDLVAGSGVCALFNGQQVAIFYLPGEAQPIYAIDNFDPIGAANVLSRGIIGDVQGQRVIASPLYKEHFSFTTGRCLEKPEYAVRVWPVRIEGGSVQLQQPAALNLESAA
ncbi:MAG: nitrite reductase [Verrucomicrobiaceae bacterium]|nr:nitrite reductase [Verrucomicrobiaceae bacterium]